MAKKQFIRHLEYYGFPDQNNYSSEINGIDLSDIREKNKEQDEEIKELEGEKATQKDLLSLSGTVDNLISVQTEINQGFSDAISGLTNDVNRLKDIDDEFANQLSAMTNVIENIDNELDEFSADTIGTIETLSNTVNEKLDKDEAEETYAKKEDVYTKEEIDGMISSGISGYATQEWVIEQGYITEDEADSRYAKDEDIQDLANIIESATTNIDEQIDEVNDLINQLSGDTENKLNNLNDAVDELSGKVDSEIEGIYHDIDDINDEISAATQSIVELQDTVAENVENIELLQSAVSANVADIAAIASELATKASQQELDETRRDLQDKIDTLNVNKADKTDLNIVSGLAESLREDLNAEIARATSAETVLGDRIDALNDVVESAVTKVETYDERISGLESGLEQEIADREQADLDLIGSSADPKTADTIWGAKNYAKSMKNEAVSEANAYTDSEVAEFENQLNDLREWSEQNFSSAATKEYVDQRAQVVEQEIENEFNTALQEEIDRATLAESNLFINIQNVSTQTELNTREIAHNATRINSITSWDGSDPEEYDDSGNGVLDVLHREFHEFEKTYGSIKEIKVVGNNLVIVYYTKEGEKEAVIPIEEFIDLSNYYTKEETNAVIQEAISHIVLDDYYTKDETDAKILEAVEDINDEIARVEEKVDTNTENISTNTTNIATLFENLGYTNNETLQTSNPGEAAFGRYNESNTSEVASGQTIFSIGIGTANDDRKNAVEVRNDGSVYMWIEGEYMKINDLLGMLAHEIYD